MVVAANDIAIELCQQRVIPQGVLKQINGINSDEGAQRLLFGHLEKHGSVNSLRTFCKVITSAAYEAYPNMQDLGREMNAMLEQGG